MSMEYDEDGRPGMLISIVLCIGVSAIVGGAIYLAHHEILPGWVALLASAGIILGIVAVMDDPECLVTALQWLVPIGVLVSVIGSLWMLLTVGPAGGLGWVVLCVPAAMLVSR